MPHANLQQNENIAKANCFSVGNETLAVAINKFKKKCKDNVNIEPIKPKTLYERLLDEICLFNSESLKSIKKNNGLFSFL